MSAFNKARYNLAPFNVQRVEGTVWASGSAKATIGFAYTGSTYFVWGNADTRILADVQLDRGMIATGSAAETITANTDIIGEIMETGTGAVVINAAVNLSQEVWTGGSATSEAEAEINLSQEVGAIGTAAEEFIPVVNLSQIIDAEADAGVIFSATVDLISLKEMVCEFPGLTLRPGQELVIDAGSYTVLLNGENAIHMQQGDWLDELSRDTQTITISATGISRVTATILYTEKYL